MDLEEYVKQSKVVVDYIVDYIENLGEKSLLSTVEPGYLKNLLPQTMPEDGEDFAEIMKDMDEKIMPGVVHWAHPHFHGYLPTSHAYPSILADMFVSSLGAMSFSWLAGPAIVEMEMAMLDWLGMSLGLPETFLNNGGNGSGGGVMSTSASEVAITTLLAARLQAINLLKPVEKRDQRPNEEDSVYLPRLIAYCSRQAHPSFEKATKMAMITLRVLPANDKGELPPDVLKRAMTEDSARGLHPCYVVVNLGTSSTGAFDDLQTLAPIVKSFPGCWLHVNAAYGGNNFICPELREPLNGIELADSLVVSPYKGLLINIDSTCVWVQNRATFCAALVVEPIYLQHGASEQSLDHRHWSLWLSRRFRSLKIWFTFRLYGVQGLQAHVRKMHKMAKLFADFVRNDERFEICNDVKTPLVCFRLRGPENNNHKLLAAVNGTGKLLMTPCNIRSKFMLRFVVSYEKTTPEMMKEAWLVIAACADEMHVAPPLPDNSFRRLSFTTILPFSQSQKGLKNIDAPIFVPKPMTKK